MHKEYDMSRLLLDAYIKVLRINLTEDSYEEIKVQTTERDPEYGYADRISRWFCDFADSGNVIRADCDKYKAFVDMDRLRQVFRSGRESDSLLYRRRGGTDEFRWVRMTIRRSYDYTDELQMVMLYVEDIHETVMMSNEIAAQAESIAHRNEELREAFTAAMAASTAKTEFLSRMSHDIRTPLNGIIGMTAIAGAHLDDTERVADSLGKITSASKHLLALINDILDLSKIESGNVSLTDAEFDLPVLLDELLDMMHTQVEAHHHQLNVYVRDIRHERVIGDNVRLQQVFMNLFSNAIKYTQDYGTINLTLMELPSASASVAQYRYICEDNGYGMSPEFVSHVFEPFERADDARIDRIQGTGLGMAIARNIINMMGGEIRVESRENVGTRFTVDFKIKILTEEDLRTEDLLDLPVLVVDDDLVICESTCITLDELGMRGEYTLSGVEAVDKVRVRHEAGDDYYACLIDWKMPDIDGFETTRRIRKVVGPDIPIIIISAYEWDNIEEEARQAGADAFISKPLFKSRLYAAFTGIPKAVRSRTESAPLDGYAAKHYTDKRLLLVEDNELNREIAQEILQMTGAQVACAGNGAEAVQMFAESAVGYYDMIFMDIRMPVMDGYEATRRIRSMDRADAAAVPIVALTANAFLEDVALGKEAGMNIHMAKPIDLDQLLAYMGEMFGG